MNDITFDSVSTSIAALFSTVDILLNIIGKKKKGYKEIFEIKIAVSEIDRKLIALERKNFFEIKHLISEHDKETSELKKIITQLNKKIENLTADNPPITMTRKR